MRVLPRPTLVLLALVLLPICGCKLIGALMVLGAPPQIAKPEFKLTKGHLAIVIDTARPAQTNPVFESALHKRIVELFRDNKVRSQVVPYDEVIQLKQAEPDYRHWSVQRIGRKLGAVQVLYLRIERLQGRTSPTDPLVELTVDLRVKVIGVPEPASHARLWPDKDREMNGRAVLHRRPPKESDSLDVIDSEAAKLGRETAYYVARLFHEYDEETYPPREP